MIILLAISVGYNIYHSILGIENVERVDTFYQERIDTFIQPAPVPVKEHIVGKLKVRSRNIPESVQINGKVDVWDVGSTVHDSVELPVVQKVYHKDSSYTAWVSGYEPRLDSIAIYNKTETITIFKHKKSKRWGIGLGLGYGVGKDGFHPYIGVGMQYNILGW